MIEYRTGNIFDCDAQAIVNPVNTVGVMGKGLALQFKKRFPENFAAYKSACKSGELRIGKNYLFEEAAKDGSVRVVVNFPTKAHWRSPSKMEYIESGLEDLVTEIAEWEIKSIAIPALGAGLGGLNWVAVKDLIEEKLGDLDVSIFIYEPL